MTSDSQAPQPQLKKTIPWGCIAVGSTVALIGIGAFVGLILTMVMVAMRSTEAYQEGMRVAQNDPRVIEALGTPIEPGLLITGSVHTVNDRGRADLLIPIHGPKGEARLRVTGSRQEGKWAYDTMLVTPEHGESIELLQGETRSSEPAR